MITVQKDGSYYYSSSIENNDQHREKAHRTKTEGLSDVPEGKQGLAIATLLT